MDAMYQKLRAVKKKLGNKIHQMLFIKLRISQRKKQLPFGDQFGIPQFLVFRYPWSPCRDALPPKQNVAVVPRAVATRTRAKPPCPTRTWATMRSRNTTEGEDGQVQVNTLRCVDITLKSYNLQVHVVMVQVKNGHRSLFVLHPVIVPACLHWS